MLLQKVKNKIRRHYFDWKLKPVQRRVFHPVSYLQELKKEPFAPCFKKPVLLLHYDDISLMHGSKFYDYGNKQGGIWDLFTSFIKAYPHLKHTLFFIPNPIFQGTGLTSKTVQNTPFDIGRANEDHPLIRELKHPSVEVALHGYHHVQTVYPHYYAPFEFDFLSVEECKEKLQLGRRGLEKFFPISGFKPPAWSLGQILGEEQLVSALKEEPFDYVCLSSPSNGLNYARQKVSHIYPSSYQGLFNIPQNISILWDLEVIYHAIDLLVEKRGVINVQLHFTETRKELKDGLCEKNLDKLCQIVHYLSQYDVEPLLTKQLLTRHSNR